jgi:hypothetical protein
MTYLIDVLLVGWLAFLTWRTWPAPAAVVVPEAPLDLPALIRDTVRGMATSGTGLHPGRERLRARLAARLAERVDAAPE